MPVKIAAHAAPRPPSRVIAAAGWVIGACLAAVMWPTVLTYAAYRAVKRKMSRRARAYERYSHAG
jgi:hypothetical protein